MQGRTGFLLFWAIFIVVAATHTAVLTMPLSKRVPPSVKPAAKSVRLQLAAVTQKAAALPKGEGLGFAAKTPKPVHVPKKRLKRPLKKKEVSKPRTQHKIIRPAKQTQPLPVPSAEPVSERTLASDETQVQEAEEVSEKSGSVSRDGAGGGTGTGGSPSVKTAKIEQLYALYLRHTLMEAKHYPVMARKRRMEGKVEVAFVITADGRIRDVRITVPSRHALLNQATIEAVRTVGRFRPLPSEIGKKTLEVTIPFVYVIK
jgi:periplasmic protein TonB